MRLNHLAILMIGLAVLVSGCADTTNTSPSNGDSESTPQQENDGSTAADIFLTSMNVPDEVEIGENFTVEATFENTGGQTGDFETTVMTRGQDSETFSSTNANIEGELDAGEQKTYEASLTAKDVSSNVIGLAGTDAQSNLRIVPKKINLGEEYTTANSIGITVERVQLTDYYRYEDIYGEQSIQESETGQYVFVNLKTQNQGDEPKSLPTSYDFQIIANNRQYDSTYLLNEPLDIGEPYEGGEVQPGIIREGYMAFEVPEDVNKQDVSIVWNELISLNEKSVYWSPN